MLIDRTKKYVIKPIPTKNKDMKELAEKGVSLFPGSSRPYVAGYDDDRQRFFNTGLDEYAPYISSLSAQEAEEERQRIKERREYIENVLRRPGFLDPTSDAWADSELCKPEVFVTDDFRVVLRGKSHANLDPTNIYDEILLGVLLSNPNIPKSKEESKKPGFKDAPFYITTEEAFSTSNRDKEKAENKARFLFDEIFDGTDKQRALEIAYYLGYSNGFTEDVREVEDRSRTLIFNTSETKDDAILKFLVAVDLDKTKLKTYNTVKRAMSLRLIEKDKKTNNYVRGAVQYRPTIDEIVELLTSPGQEMELAELVNDVSRKMKGRK